MLPNFHITNSDIKSNIMYRKIDVHDVYFVYGLPKWTSFLICATGLPVGDQLNDSNTTVKTVSLKRFCRALTGKGLVVVADGVNANVLKQTKANDMVLKGKRSGNSLAGLTGLVIKP
jgi:hypothetical protein